MLLCKVSYNTCVHAYSLSMGGPSGKASVVHYNRRLNGLVWGFCRLPPGMTARRRAMSSVTLCAGTTPTPWTPRTCLRCPSPWCACSPTWPCCSEPASTNRYGCTTCTTTHRVFGNTSGLSWVDTHVLESSVQRCQYVKVIKLNLLKLNRLKPADTSCDPNRYGSWCCCQV